MPLASVPQAGQYLGQTQPDILNNFNIIESGWIVDHVDWGITGAGWHNKVTFPVQTSAPTFATGQIGLYNLANTLTGANELNIQKGTAAAIPMTAALANQNGWSYLPSGILLVWGTSSALGNTTTTITFPAGANIPAFNNIFSMQITTNNGSNSVPNQLVSLGNYTTTNFVVYNRQLVGSSSTVNFTYLAIGN